jgi:3-dehydroquinate dehydratase / shikimate dehydrogenase
VKLLDEPTIPVTCLIASLVADKLSRLDERACAAFDAGATAVELRVDRFDGTPQALNNFLRNRADRTWIITLRSRNEGGRSDLSAIERADWLTRAVANTDAWIDFEFADWRGAPDARERLNKVLVGHGAGKRRLILSAHRFTGPFDDAELLVQSMLAEPLAAVAKIAFTANDIRDSFSALDLIRRHGSRVIAVAMGEDGLWTRVLAKKLGAFGSFAALEANDPTAPGQLTIDAMNTLYRWRNIDHETRVFGVIGDPVGHSMSPLLFNRWFAQHNVNAVYLPLRVRGGSDELGHFLDQCLVRPWLSLSGCSVTIPHKSSALEWAGGGADAMARSIGAANTLVFRNNPSAVASSPQTANRKQKPAITNESGSPIHCSAFNTDCYAAMDSLCEALECPRADLSKFRFDILGAGGAARALIYGLQEYGGSGTIFARNLDAATKLASTFHFDAAQWDKRVDSRGDIVINTTSIGMYKRTHDDASSHASTTDESPLPPESLSDRRLVFDLIYNPLQTKLLRDAATTGIPALNGLDMFIRQAAVQFELWTSIKPDLTSARQFLADALT